MADLPASTAALSNRMPDRVPDRMSAAPAAAPEVERPRRQWQQPLGDIHNKLSNIVGAGSLAINFDCNDQDFVFALTSHWPLGNDFTQSLYEADTLKLADALNGLVRLYAIETGQERLHVMLEARRGKPELPGWWRGPAGSAPVLFATYAFDTNFAQVGLFGDLDDAYADMDLLTHPHRLLVAIGPGTPVMVDADGSEIVLDADEERLLSLKKWNQRLARQINQLLAETLGGGEAEIEAVMEALSKVRDLSSRLAAQLIEREGRLRRRAGKRDELTDELYDSVRPRAGKRAPLLLQAEAKPSDETKLGETLAGLQDALKSDSLTGAMTPAARADLQKSLETLTAPKIDVKKPEVKTPMVKPTELKKTDPAAELLKQPERRPVAQPLKAGPKPGASLAILLCLLAAPALARGDGARSDGSFGLAPYRDTMRYYEYAANDDPRLSSGGNGTVTPRPVAAVSDDGNRPLAKAKPAPRKKARKDDSYKPSQQGAKPADTGGGDSGGTAAAGLPGGKWEEDKNNCAGRAAKTARRRYGNVPIEVFSDGTEGAAIVGGKRYTYRCSGNPETGLLEFRPDKD